MHTRVTTKITTNIDIDTFEADSVMEVIGEDGFPEIAIKYAVLGGIKSCLLAMHDMADVQDATRDLIRSLAEKFDTEPEAEAESGLSIEEAVPDAPKND